MSAFANGTTIRVSHNSIAMEPEFLPKSFKDDLLKMGVVVMHASGEEHWHTPMVVLVKQLLNSTQDLDALLGPAIEEKAGFPVNVRLALMGLDMYIDTLPHDVFPLVPYAFASGVPAVVFMLLRMWYKKSFAGGLKRDDWAMFSAASLTALFIIGIIINCRGPSIIGACHHVWDISYIVFRRNLLAVFVGELMYVVANLLIKVSLLLFYYDLAPIKWLHRTVIYSFVVTVLGQLSAVFVVVFQCRPAWFWYDPLNAQCLNMKRAILIVGIVGICTDILSLLIPVPLVIYSMSLKTSQKLAVIGMFCLGFVACTAGILRVVVTNWFVGDPDGVYKEGWAALFASLELNLAIIVYTFPAVRSLFMYYYKRYFVKEQQDPGFTPYRRRKSAFERVMRFRHALSNITDLQHTLRTGAGTRLSRATVITLPGDAKEGIIDGVMDPNSPGPSMKPDFSAYQIKVDSEMSGDSQDMEKGELEPPNSPASPGGLTSPRWSNSSKGTRPKSLGILRSSVLSSPGWPVSPGAPKSPTYPAPASGRNSVRFE